MKVGLVARADDRGIGTMTWEFHRAMRPDRTLVVREPGAERRGFEPHVERYPDARVVTFEPQRGELPEVACREFLRGLDVVYLVETPYDFRFFEWARAARCVTVLHVMPEFWRWHETSYRPDVWWLPTCWRATTLPDECRIVEVPVPLAPKQWSTNDAPMFVHAAGHRAVGDRNGTLLLYQALRSVTAPISVRLFTQDARLPTVRTRPNVELQVEVGGVPDRWSLYDDAAVLVLPRRYGGLCLPALEAMACGVGLCMSDVEPQRSTWPIHGVRAHTAREIVMPCGPLRSLDVEPVLLARALDELATQPKLVDNLRDRARVFAFEHSWSALRSMYLDELARACDRPLRVV